MARGNRAGEFDAGLMGSGESRRAESALTSRVGKKASLGEVATLTEKEKIGSLD